MNPAPTPAPQAPRVPHVPREDLPPGTLETDAVTVRTLEPGDLDAIVRIDREWTGRNRRNYYELKLAEAAHDTGVRISLVAEIEEGQDRRVAGALMRQLRMNLAALNIEKVETQVDWDQFELLRFFAREGFAPARRICLELEVTRPAE